MTKDNSIYEDRYFIKQSDLCLTSAAKFMGYGAIVGTGLSAIVAQTYEPHVSMLEAAGRSAGRIVFPAVLLGGMFASTTCLMDEVRGKNKPLSNGFLGGAAAGAVLATRTHSPGKIASYAFMGGLLGFTARFVGTNGLVNQSAADKYNELNKSIVMSDISHLKGSLK